jgi:hypothetical protein
MPAFGSYSPLSPVPRSQVLTLLHRLNRFAQSKALSFVPPDGRFTLMEYRFDPSASKPGAAPALTAAAAGQLQVQVPFTLRATLSITNHGGPFLPPSLPIATHQLTPPWLTQAPSSYRSPRVQARSRTSPSSSTSAPEQRAHRARARRAAASGCMFPRDARCAGHSPPLPLQPPAVRPAPSRDRDGPRRCGARSRAAMRTRAPRARRRYHSRCLRERCLVR